ncbi:MAG: hypothetical protein A2087_12875 [Spirochaetes bacterium GWD1_61_31]|nr:MAG: hypothetical protein A2Y37_02225 [Spirochaetes bacterium GWB1_60_80]OHD35033.1 MAG: hypothetical protein A2004_00835 [Spirochaetes bacterium GWC1_61_12]OHD35650.1 MAG: hypothetical protein A2087_12875 [Spirochaetes bacterium GWD1_61_31]OHD41744.1 MAG: hypothetical protein A2Y35_09095 [Spirochaetes bacterium GWE1_60_18]OHD61603.1 MAG: hypothetical protein A2Y32_01405 [Spirochaetes bacterium GWF1_60_12]HAP44036.1 sigma-70 family RNA polymerase sigma factor [Spirochaetaceae bacterium]
MHNNSNSEARADQFPAGLRAELVKFVRRKFYSRPDIASMAEDIVQEAFLALCHSMGAATAPEAGADKRNFGYLSVVCLRIGYKYFKAYDADHACRHEAPEWLELVAEGDFVADLLRQDDTALVLASLETLKRLERLIVRQRYFGADTFAAIARRHGLKLNTVLSHHRRALEKLRSRLTGYFREEEES